MVVPSLTDSANGNGRQMALQRNHGKQRHCQSGRDGGEETAASKDGTCEGAQDTSQPSHALGPTDTRGAALCGIHVRSNSEQAHLNGDDAEAAGSQGAHDGGNRWLGGG